MSNLTQILVVGAVALLAGGGVIYLSVRRPGWYRRVLPWLGMAFGVLALAVAGLMTYVAIVFGPILAGPDHLTDEELGQPAESFAFRLVEEDAEGVLEDYRGNVVLLNLWATWCGPCIVELPYLNQLQETYGEEGLVVITMSNESRDEILSFARERPFSTVNVYIQNEARLPQPFRRGYRAIPTTYIIDREGYIRDFFVGSRDYAFFEGKVTPLL